jgi:hypothetical protein
MKWQEAKEVAGEKEDLMGAEKEKEIAEHQGNRKRSDGLIPGCGIVA